MSAPFPRRRVKLARLGMIVTLAAVVGGGVYLLHIIQVRRQAGALLTRAEAAADKGDHAAAAKLYQSYLNFRPKDAAAVAKYAGTLEELARAKPAVVHDLLKVYEQLLTLDPARADARRKLARHYVSVEYYAAARDHLKGLLASQPGDAEVFELYAVCEEREGKPAAVAGWLRKAVETGTAAPETYLRLALLLKLNGETTDPEQAEAVITRLVESRPQDIGARITRARYRMRVGEPHLAKEDVAFAYRSLPGGDADPNVALALAEVAATDIDLRTARTALEAASKAAPNDPRLPLATARVQLRLADEPAARTTLQAAADRFKRPDLSLLEIADRLLDLGETQTALAVAERFAAEHAFLADYLLGRAKLADGNWPAALDHFRKATAGGLARYRTQHLTALLGEADCHRLANIPDLRLKAFGAVLAIDKANLPAQLGRAECLLHTGRVREAVAAYHALAPRSPAARAALCQLLIDDQMTRPDADRSWAAVEEALGSQPTVELELLRGRMLLGQGRSTDALALFERVVKTAPDVPPARIALALARGRTEPAAGLAVLDRADRELGDRVEFRLARAQLLTRTADPDLPAIAALAHNTGAFGKHQRFRLFAELGDLFAAMGRPKEAADLLLRAVAEMPHYLHTRATVFGIAQDERNLPLQDRMLAELKAIEGPDGPVTVLAEASRAIRAAKPGATAELREKLTGVLAKRPGWGWAHALLGDLDLLDGKADAAADRYLRAADLGMQTRSAIRLALLTKAQVTLGRITSARDTAARLKALSPNSWEAVSAAARVRAADGDKAGAGRVILAATENADPRVASTLVGPFLEEIGCVEAAEQVYRKLTKGGQLGPLGSFYLRTGQARKAADLAFTHEGTAPVGVTARLLSGAARSRQPSFVPAAERAEWEKTLSRIDRWVQTARAAHPRDHEVLFAQAGLDDLFERYDDEVRALEEALRLDPGNDVYLNNLATVLALTRKDPERALGAVEEAIRRKGPRPAYLDTRALVHLTAGRFDDAAQDLTAAVGLDPKPVYYYHLALVAHRQAGDKPDLAVQRNQAWAEARRRGFHEGMLHPKEVDEFRRFSVELAVR